MVGRRFFAPGGNLGAATTFDCRAGQTGYAEREQRHRAWLGNGGAGIKMIDRDPVGGRRTGH